MPDHPHLAALDAALVAEADWVRREHARQVELPLAERIAVGLSAGPLDLLDDRPGGWGRRRLELRLQRGVPWHEGIRPGDPVRMLPLGGEGWLDATVDLAEEGDYEIVTHRALTMTGPFELQKRLDQRTTERYRAALGRADRDDFATKALLLEPAPNGEPVDHPAFGGLEASQREAAAAALASPLAGIHGPPGTGKTHTIVALLQAWRAREERVLALADSNAAVDHLAGRAAAAGLRVLRLGHPARFRPEIAALGLEARVRAGMLGPALEAIGRDLDKLAGDRSRQASIERKRLTFERRRLLDQARRDEIERADVVASTFGTLAIVDEATQAIEPAVWVAAPLVDRLVLVGDPNQLGPVVKQPGNPLDASLLQRLVGSMPLPMLQVQRRMHEQIQQLIDPVYDDGLVADPAVARRGLLDLPGVEPAPLTERATLWLDHAGAGFEEERDPVTRSLHNAGERRLVVAVVNQLRAAGVAAERIAVIAPYSAQVQRLRPELPGIEVDTVNAFQGREQDVVICSWVRSNGLGELGFVADGRRLTVALSRARRLHVSIGDSATLCSAPRFADLLDVFGAQDAIDTVWSPPWSAALD
jgi:ATP-dependent RNA/DNA helicase IGHMBP2